MPSTKKDANKYQEALNTLEREHTVNDLCQSELSTLQELVDRATPMKPKILFTFVRVPDGKKHQIKGCPYCEMAIEKHETQTPHFCHNCGKAIKDDEYE